MKCKLISAPSLLLAAAALLTSCTGAETVSITEDTKTNTVTQYELYE